VVRAQHIDLGGERLLLQRQPLGEAAGAAQRGGEMEAGDERRAAERPLDALPGVDAMLEVSDRLGLAAGGGDGDAASSFSARATSVASPSDSAMATARRRSAMASSLRLATRSTAPRLRKSTTLRLGSPPRRSRSAWRVGEPAQPLVGTLVALAMRQPSSIAARMATSS
jgi:hypothetical protein